MPFKIAGSQEFFTSDVAFPAFEKAYGFKVKPSQEVQVGTGDTALTEKAAAQGTDGVNAAMAYGTDGTISALEPRGPDRPEGRAADLPAGADVLRTRDADQVPRDPGAARARSSSKLDLPDAADAQQGRSRVDGKDPKVVAADWLKSNGFVK